MKHIVIFTGASGAGKTTLAELLLERDRSLGFVRSATTRGKRNDAHDSEYNYLTEDEFKAEINNGTMLEYMKYDGNFYGTPKSELDRIFASGKTPLLVLDLEGVKSFRRLSLDFSVFVFYIFDELDVIEQRLYDRMLKENPTVEKLQSFAKRCDANKRDYLLLPELIDCFDFFIRNSSLKDAILEIEERYSALKRGLSPESEANSIIAEYLAESARRKK